MTEGTSKRFDFIAQCVGTRKLEQKVSSDGASARNLSALPAALRAFDKHDKQTHHEPHQTNT